MKYGIEEQLAPQHAELAQRFHVAMLQRMYELQRGASASVGNALDCAITMMEVWGKSNSTDGVSVVDHQTFSQHTPMDGK